MPINIGDQFSFILRSEFDMESVPFNNMCRIDFNGGYDTAKIDWIAYAPDFQSVEVQAETLSFSDNAEFEEFFKDLPDEWFHY